MDIVRDQSDRLAVIQAMRDGWRVGYAEVLIPATGELRMPWLGVNAPDQRQGVGTRLLAEVRAIAEELGRPARTALFVPGLDGGNHAFYQRAGCVWDPATEEYWIKGAA